MGKVERELGRIDSAQEPDRLAERLSVVQVGDRGNVGAGRRFPVLVSVLVAVVIVAASWLAKEASKEEAQAGMTRALASLAIARTISATISFAEGTNVSFEPFGVGVTIAPGALLRPVGEALEHFASLMLAASVAFGVELLLIKIGAHWAVSALVTALALAWIAFLFLGRCVPVLLSRLFLIALVLRFAVPLTAFASEAVYRAFMSAQYDAAHKDLASTSDAIKGQIQGVEQTAAAAGAETDKGMWEKVKEFRLPWGKRPDGEIRLADKGVMGKAKEWAAKLEQVRHVPEQLRGKAEQMMARIVDLIVVFLLQTIVVPLFFLWTLLALGRSFLVRLTGGTERLRFVERD